MTNLPAASATAPVAEQESEQKEGGRAWYFWALVGIGAVVAVFIIGLVVALAVALLADPDDAATWVGIIRDMFIIVLAMEGMLMGFALIVLVIQVAALVNLLQNEIKPIVDNANETVTTVRGTAQFMSQNVVEPVVKFTALTAGIAAVVREALGIRRALRPSDRNGKKTD
ncbi:MAG: hypothetical protein EHM39_07505 [Chloroflexi bacterium]|nr:MAG: hypothetical protein EHM39_07505 [Chloroflexota bacterium]